MDSILYVGSNEDTLPKFLEKLGYLVIQRDASVSLPDCVAKAILDLIVVDARGMPDAEELCSFFRTQESTRQLPIVYISPEGTGATTPTFEKHDKIEVVPGPLSIGRLAGKIATQLRLRKFDGRDELRSTLAEANSALRDFNDRFKRELDEARTIQESLLPASLPCDSRVEVAVSYQPLEGVGGDWYFAKSTAQGLSLQIADVTGHGLSAAFIGSMAKLAMTAADTDVPHELLKAMNKLMAPQLPPGRFVTMGSCLYDPVTGGIKWARAGHPPALLLRRSKNVVEQLIGDGFAVGFFEDSDYELVESSLAPGDALLIYTDGISEAQSRDMEVFGFERLSAALLSCDAKASSAEMLSHLLDVFDEFRQERILKDDVTVLLLKRLS